MKTLVILFSISTGLFAIADSAVDWEMMEETGESGLLSESHGISEKAPAVRGEVLLIPDSGEDVVAMFSPYDGTYWGNLIVDDTTGTYDLSTPVNAVEFEDMIFLSDQIADAVYCFDEEGNYLYTAADTTWLNNIRGIDFRDDTLYVTSGDDYVAMFSGPMTFAGYFIQDGTDPFDIMFVDEIESGSALYCDIQGTTDNVRHYHADGTLLGELFQLSFPEQVQVDVLNPGYYLVAGFSEDSIFQFTIDGTITDSWYLNGVRGAYRLGNGNLMVTDGSGMHEMDASTGAIIETEYSGSGRFIELADLPGVHVADDPAGVTVVSDMSLYPNPFSSLLSIGFSLAQPAPVRVDIFDVSGRVVESMEPGYLGSGQHTVTWDGTALGQGIYFVRVATPDGMMTRKVNLIR